MNIEVREDSVKITGYVNAVERYSKTIREKIDGVIRTFIERIRAGVFRTALQRNDDVKVLLNHDSKRELATTKNGTAKLEEDNIGLRAEVIITDKEVVEKARNNQLVGWSFGFYRNSDEFGREGNSETRTITDLDLIEVSILDDTKSPAYYGTSIEARDKRCLEYREESIEEIEDNAMKEHEKVYDDSEKKHHEIEKQKEEAKLELLVEKITLKVLEKLKEGTDGKETTPNSVEVENNSQRNFDYFSFEERINKLKKSKQRGGI